MHPQTTCYYTLSAHDIKPSHAPAVDQFIKKHAPITHASNIVLRPRQRNIFQKCTESIQLEYYRYEVTFGLYVLTPNEKLAANTFVSIVICLLVWALLHVPSWLYTSYSKAVILAGC